MSRRFELYGTDLLGGGMCALAVALLPMSGLLDETGLQQRTRLVAQRQALDLAPDRTVSQAVGPADAISGADSRGAGRGPRDSPPRR